MGDVAIVAIPAEDDPVWKVSSEKVPHMTLLFLKGPLENEENTIRFVQHAVSTSLCRFGMNVDRRGLLGEDDADVLFFQKSYGFKKLLDFRGFLLTNTDILTAYQNAPQYPTWTPHLTLGYPKTPAKPNPNDYGLSWVNFDRIAIWTEDYDGPEFLMKSDDSMAIDIDGAWSIEEMDEYLKHHGVLGMKWGVRNDDKGGSGRSRATAKKAPAPKAPAKPISEKRIAKAKKTDRDIKELDKFIKDLEGERDALPEKARIRRRAAQQDINFYKNWRDNLQERSDDLKSGRLTDTQKKMIVYGVAATAIVGASTYIAVTNETNRRLVSRTMGDGFDDFVMSPNGKTFRISSAKEVGAIHEFTYTNGLLQDARKYRGGFGARMTKIGVKNPIKVAGADSARKILEDISNSPIDPKKYKIMGPGDMGKFLGQHDDVLGEIAAKALKPSYTLRDMQWAGVFADSPTGFTSSAHWISRGGPAATAQAANAFPGYAEFIRDEFIARGYNGMVDLNNFQSLADMPLILFKDSANLVYHSELGQQMDEGKESLDDVLMHYGVLGMRWGVRRDVGPDGRVIRNSTPKGGVKKAKAGSTSSQSSSKKKSGSQQSTTKPKRRYETASARRRREIDELLDQLTTKEIQEINNRVRATQEYRRLQKEEQLRLRSSKKKFADWLLGINQPKQKKKGSNLKDGIEVAKLTKSIMEDVVAAKKLTQNGG